MAAANEANRNSPISSYGLRGQLGPVPVKSVQLCCTCRWGYSIVFCRLSFNSDSFCSSARERNMSGF